MPVGLAVIGLGRMGTLYVEIIKRYVDDARLVGVLSRRYSRASEIASAYGVRAYKSLDELLRDEKIDGVIVATPSYTHAEIIVRAAEEGKHVFTEKPIDVDLGRAREAVKAVEKHGVRLLVGYMRRFDEAYRKAKEMIEEGRIGKPIIYIGVSKDPEPPPKGWLRDPRLSGGLLLDLMSHDYDLARWYLGEEPVEVYASGGVYIYDYMRDVGDHDNAVVEIRMRDGKLALVYGSRRSSYGYDVRSEIHGTDGTIFIGVEYDTSMRIGLEGSVKYYGHMWFRERFLKAYIEEIKHFTRVIKGVEEPMVTGYDALIALKVAVAARKSIEEGRPVRLEEIEEIKAP